MKAKSSGGHLVKTGGLRFTEGRLGLIIALVVLVVAFSFLSDYFLTWLNFTQLLLAVAINGILASGMTLVVVSKGIDLSVGSVVAFGSTVLGYLMSKDYSLMSVAMLLCVFIGVGAGLINGLCITKLRISPLITTLATMTAFRAAAMLFSDGVAFGIKGSTPAFPDFGFWGRGTLLSIPAPVWLMILVSVLVYLLLNRTIFGRKVYAIGGNEEAAHVSGINVNRTKMIIYTINGLICGFAGIILASRLAAGVPSAAIGYELTAVSAVVLGGTSLDGGKGRIFDTFLAVIVLGVLANGFVLLGLPRNWEDFARGCILIIAVGIDQFRQRRTSNE